MRKIISCVALVFGFIMPGLSAEIYVDSASSSQSPDGSVDSPYKTIAAAVNAANSLTEEASTVFVKGNHLIDGEDDLVTVTATGMTIRAWGDVKPLVEISKDLSAELKDDNPKVFSIARYAADCAADDCTVKDIKFKYYSVNEKKREGNSLGKKGVVVSVSADRFVISSCEFRREGERNNDYGGGGVIYNDTAEGGNTGKNMLVSDCWFEGVGYKDSPIVRTSSENKIVGNVYINCTGDYMHAVKQTTGGYFVSNRVVNCLYPIKTNYDNYSEIPNAEIAYNIFVGSNIPFINRNSTGRGMSGSPKIHHNTIVGCDCFIYVDGIAATTDAMKNDEAWAPWVFDNLIVLAEGGSIIREHEINSLGLLPTSFFVEDNEPKKPFLKGNVYYAATFSDGTATFLNGYNLYGGGLICENNRALAMAPEFLNTTDITSEDYYRINSKKYPWVITNATGADGFTSEYVGAVPPKAIDATQEGEYFQVDEFTVEYDSLFAPVNVKFTVGYSQHAGDVEVSWDFDGDGQYDQTSQETSVSHTYINSGNYQPAVKVKDTKTGKEISVNLPSGALKVSMLNVYVDANVEITGDGTKEYPFKTIREGVVACGRNGTVYVKGGADRIYKIVTADDLVVFNVREILLRSEIESERVCVDIDPKLHANTNNPAVFAIATGADYVTIRGFDFTYYGNKDKQYDGDSLGKKGRVIDIFGDYVTIENCVFIQQGDMSSVERGEDKHCAVGSRAKQGVGDLGRFVKVIGCRFEGKSPSNQMTTIMCGKDTEIVNNVFTNCYWMYYPVKQLDCDFTFVSNRMVNCRSMYSNSGGYNEMPRAEIAYNIFVTDVGEPFITKEHNGLHGDVYIHHNTVVGSTNFVNVTVNMKSSWRPVMYDNMIVLSAGGALFQEDEPQFSQNASSSFKTDGGAAFTNNVYMADKFDAGKALSLEGYDLSKGLKVENNTVIAEAPRFMSTDVNSPDFMRPRARKGDYPFSAAVGGYPNYVGAQEPKLRPEGMRVIIR